MITLKHIRKTFRVARRNAGFGEAVKSLFHREYETIEALSDISFHIEAGEMVGYIGPNGAGKSSTIKIMSGILTPDSGECLINGCVPWKDRIRHVQEIGVVFGQRSQLWWDVPVVDSFSLLRDIYKIPEQTYHNNLEELTSLLQIETIIQTPARQLSLGQRMRCEIVASLLHSPKILFLDEPTIGLDAVSKIAVRHFIQKINQEHKTTVILTTHDMQDIEALTQRIIFIGKGKILLDGSLQELKKHYADHKTITVEYNGTMPFLEKGMQLLENSAQGHAVIGVDTAFSSVSDVILLFTQQTEIKDIIVGNPSLDEVVVKMYQEYHV